MTHTRSKFAAVLTIAVASAILLATPARGRDDAAIQKEGWTKLGEKDLDKDKNREDVAVGVGKGNFKALKLSIKGPATRIDSVKVVFAVGKDEDLDFKGSLPKDGETKALELQGSNRVIRRLVITYTASGEKVTLKIWGRE